jgi:hypothetical protein
MSAHHCSRCNTSHIPPVLGYGGLVQLPLMLAIVGTLGLYGISFWLAERISLFQQIQNPKAVLHLLLTLFALVFFLQLGFRCVCHWIRHRRYQQLLRTGICPICAFNILPPLPTEPTSAVRPVPKIPTTQQLIDPDSKLVGEQAEKAFKEQAEANGFQVEYLDQSPQKYAERTKVTKGSIKQEDYLLRKSGLVVAVEVKARKLFNIKGENHYGFQYSELGRLERQEEYTGIKIYLAVYERIDSISIDSASLRMMQLEQFRDSFTKYYESNHMLNIPVTAFTPSFTLLNQ